LKLKTDIRQGKAFESVRLLFTGGAPTSMKTLAKVVRVWTGAEVLVVYGSTEAEPVASIGADELLHHCRGPSLAGSGCCVGTPVEQIEVMVLPLEHEAHEAAEEQTLYAEVLAHCRDVRLVSQGIEDHDAIVQLASALAKTDPHHEGWLGMLRHFNELLAFHLDDEENRIVGQLRRAVTQERAEALGERFETLKADEVAVWGNDPSTLLSLGLAESAATG